MLTVNVKQLLCFIILCVPLCKGTETLTEGGAGLETKVALEGRGVGVCDGDVVYVRRQTTAEDGEIVVAMVEDAETGSWSATLKRFFRDEARGVYILHPENPSLEDIVLNEVFIVGVAVKVLKSL